MNRRTLIALTGLVAVAVSTGAAAQDFKQETMSRQLDGDRPVAVDVHYAVGRLNIRPSTSSRLLYSMTLEYDQEFFRPINEYAPGELRIGAESVRRRVRLSRDMEGGELDLELSPLIPMDLSMEFGAVRADIDLGGLQITRLQFKTGASETSLRVSKPNPERARVASFKVGAASFAARELGNLNAERIEVDAGVGDIRLDFTGQWEADARVSIDMGLGSLELRLPKGLGVKLVKETFLVSLDSQGLVKRGDAYYSLDYEQADVRLTIDIDAAFGSVDIVWVR